MKRLSNLLLLMIGMTMLAAAAFGQGDAKCVTSQCHANKATGKYVHGPVGAGACTVCHVPTQGEDHKFTYFAEKEELCLGCHESNREMMFKKSVHKAVLDGNCTGCHDPHQSDYQYTLKGNAADLCYRCHDPKPFQQNTVHGPIRGGDCNACHNPHATDFPNQLISAPDQLCLGCHEEMKEKKEKRHVHPPVSEKCTSCHSPHSSVASKLLIAEIPELCFKCHEEFPLAEVEHSPVKSGDCGACHDVHASDYPRMMLSPLTDLCYSCHEDMGKHVRASAFKHGPVKDGDCNACHNPHGSNNYRLLKKYFPHEFYMPYATENYAMCFECHNPNVALDEKTKTLTDFRNGDTNLHYLHVNKKVKGRSCKACHEPHATDQEKHIRKSVPYGTVNWELPVAFTKLKDGGSCVVGCHSPKEYHR